MCGLFFLFSPVFFMCVGRECFFCSHIFFARVFFFFCVCVLFVCVVCLVLCCCPCLVSSVIVCVILSYVPRSSL